MDLWDLEPIWEVPEQLVPHSNFHWNIEPGPFFSQPMEEKKQDLPKEVQAKVDQKFYDGTWMVDKDKLLKRCSLLHAKCRDIYGDKRLFLMPPNVDKFKEPADCLITYLFHLHREFEIKTEFPHWLDEICGCIVNLSSREKLKEERVKRHGKRRKKHEDEMMEVD